MKQYAVYRKSKRAKDLLLIEWPIAAENEADAVRIVREKREHRAEPVARLRAVEYRGNMNSGMAGPPVRISHSHYTRPL